MVCCAVAISLPFQAFSSQTRFYVQISSSLARFAKVRGTAKLSRRAFYFSFRHSLFGFGCISKGDATRIPRWLKVVKVLHTYGDGFLKYTLI
jgi:hypothetical protein